MKGKNYAEIYQNFEKSENKKYANFNFVIDV